VPEIRIDREHEMANPTLASGGYGTQRTITSLEVQNAKSKSGLFTDNSAPEQIKHRSTEHASEENNWPDK
jgi:hypothetical protein